MGIYSNVGNKGAIRRVQVDIIANCLKENYQYSLNSGDRKSNFYMLTYEDVRSYMNGRLDNIFIKTLNERHHVLIRGFLENLDTAISYEENLLDIIDTSCRVRFNYPIYLSGSTDRDIISFSISPDNHVVLQDVNDELLKMLPRELQTLVVLSTEELEVVSQYFTHIDRLYIVGVECERLPDMHNMSVRSLYITKCPNLKTTAGHPNLLYASNNCNPNVNIYDCPELEDIDIRGTEVRRLNIVCCPKATHLIHLPDKLYCLNNMSMDLKDIISSLKSVSGILCHNYFIDVNNEIPNLHVEYNEDRVHSILDTCSSYNKTYHKELEFISNLYSKKSPDSSYVSVKFADSYNNLYKDIYYDENLKGILTTCNKLGIKYELNMKPESSNTIEVVFYI